jgi:hypothetical protein
MASRNQRRKRKALRDAQYAIFQEAQALQDAKAAIIKANLCGNRGKVETVTTKLRLKRDGSIEPIRERRKVVSVSIPSCLANAASQSHRGYVCRAGGSMERKRALALKLQGKY